jgi:hypothetical protein
MLPTYEAVLQPNGQFQFMDPLAERSELPRRILVTFTDEAEVPASTLCGAQLTVSALATDWLNDEEDAAWAHLQSVR